MSHFTPAPRHAVRNQRRTLTMISQWRCVNSGGAILLVRVSDFQKIFWNCRFKVEKWLHVALTIQYWPYGKGLTRRKQQKPTVASERHQGGIIFPFVKFPKTKKNGGIRSATHPLLKVVFSQNLYVQGSFHLISPDELIPWQSGSSETHTHTHTGRTVSDHAQRRLPCLITGVPVNRQI